jgi:ElaB/YqjD/DUF883 family membrane-anchored ribosome-binding protein
MEDPMTDQIDSNTAAQTAKSSSAEPGKFSLMGQLARTAASGSIDRVSGILTGAADSIDEILGRSDLPLPESAKSAVSSTSNKLRAIADRATVEEAEKLLENLQKTAAYHPAATAGIGAAIGAALGIALAKLGDSNGSKSGARKTAKA